VPLNTVCTGVAYVRERDGSVGPTIPGVEVTFAREDGALTRRVMTGINGQYRVDLPPARYIVEASHPEYGRYSTVPSYVVLTVGRPGTHTVFLPRLPAATTILLIRHAEPDPQGDPYNPPLSQDGQARAAVLCHVAQKARVAAIFTTDTQRTLQTVAPLAAQAGLQPIVYGYNSLEQLARQVLSQYYGKVVLVVGHSPSVPDIVSAFGGKGSQYCVGNEFDNLIVITVSPYGKTVAANLQYGTPS
jgi:phosphohistidine phosphatase SixA